MLDRFWLQRLRQRLTSSCPVFFSRPCGFLPAVLPRDQSLVPKGAPMKVQIHVIPVDPTNPPTIPNNLGPPVTALYHYTTVKKLRLIINSGHIRPSTARIEPNEKPVVWFSSRPTWEPTATKCPFAGKLGELVTASVQGGLARISVPPSTAPYIFPQLPLIAGTTPATCVGLLMAGVDLGADPDQWRFTPEPVPVSLFREVELFDFEQDQWRAIDMAELACRN